MDELLNTEYGQNHSNRSGTRVAHTRIYMHADSLAGRQAYQKPNFRHQGTENV
jgi:hypothetical protein